jgi:hypothetical protein
MAGFTPLSGPIIRSKDLENGVLYQVWPGPGTNGVVSMSVVPIDRTSNAPLSGSLRLSFGMKESEMDLSAGDLFRALNGPAAFFLEATGLDPNDNFEIHFRF